MGGKTVLGPVPGSSRPFAFTSVWLASSLTFAGCCPEWDELLVSEGALEPSTLDASIPPSMIDAASVPDGDALADASLNDGGPLDAACELSPSTFSHSAWWSSCVDEGVETFFGSVGRTQAECDASYAEMTPVKVAPLAARWRQLPRTLTTLCCRGTLRVTMVGDSIVNDTSRSRWEDYLVEATGAVIDKVTSVRGSTGSLFYAEGARMDCAALLYEPDLLILAASVKSTSSRCAHSSTRCSPSRPPRSCS
jgi:hypothetical protein